MIRCVNQANVENLSQLACINPSYTLQRTIDFGTCVEDLARMMGEPSQMCAILLARDRLRHFTGLDVEYLDNLIVAARDDELSLVVEIKRRYKAVLLGRFEHLANGSIRPATLRGKPIQPLWTDNYG